jgi:O-phosphoseryl-tRNA(Cys) synthetase
MQQKYKIQKDNVSFLLRNVIPNGHKGKLIADHIFKSLDSKFEYFSIKTKLQSIKEIVDLYEKFQISTDDLKKKVADGYKYYHNLIIDYAFNEYYPDPDAPKNDQKKQIVSMFSKAIIPGCERQFIIHNLFDHFPNAFSTKIEPLKEIADLYIKSEMTLDDLKKSLSKHMKITIIQK